MSGTAAVWYLLAHNAPVLAAVPLTRIKEGYLPLAATLPGIEIRRVSGTPRLTIAMTEANRLHSERVQVSVLTKLVEATPSGTGKRGADAILALIRAALPNQRGTVNSVTIDSILPDTIGPDLIDVQDGIHQGSQDFIVKWKT